MSTDEDDIRLKLAVEAFHHLGAAINVSVEKIAKQLPDMESTNRQAVLVALLDLVAQAEEANAILRGGKNG